MNFVASYVLHTTVFYFILLVLCSYHHELIFTGQETEVLRNFSHQQSYATSGFRCGMNYKYQVQFQVHCLLCCSGVRDTAQPSHAMCLQGRPLGRGADSLSLFFPNLQTLQFSLSSSLVPPRGQINYVRVQSEIHNDRCCLLQKL